jgi:hypothetical protein
MAVDQWIVISVDAANLEQKLNELAADNWDIVQITKSEGNQWKIFAKDK